MQNAFQEVKITSPKEKNLRKDFSSNFKQALSKKYSKNSNAQIKTDKNKLNKSNTKITIKKSKETSKAVIKPYLSNNEINIQNKNKNTTNNKNINDNKLSQKNKKNKTKSSNNICHHFQSPPINSNILKNKKNNSRNDYLKNIKSPQLSDFIKNNNLNTKNNNQRNNNVLKLNFDLLITKNQNYDEDSLINNNESYFGKNKIQNNIKDTNKNYSKTNEISSEDYLIKPNKNNDINENSSLLNSIMSINRYLSNDSNSKSKTIINKKGEFRDKSNKSKSTKIYENQIIKTPISKDISRNDKNITNVSKSDFLEDCNLNNKKKELLNNNLTNNEYYCSINTSNRNKIIKKRKSFCLDEFNNKHINKILRLNTPRISINNKIIQNFQLSPKLYNINKTLAHHDSEIKNCSKNRIKVSKAKIYKNSDEFSNYNKESNSQKDINAFSTKNSTNKMSNNIDEMKNSMQINEFKIINEFNIINEENSNKNVQNNNQCNNIFDEEYYDNKEEKENKAQLTQLNKYNLLTCEKPEDNNNKYKKRKSNFSYSSYIYSPINIHNKYSTLSSERGYNYNCTNLDSDYDPNYEQYLNTIDDDNSKIQEIKINLNNRNKNKNKINTLSQNKPNTYVYCHSPSYRHTQNGKNSFGNIDNNFLNNSNYSNDNSYEKINNPNIYMKQIFSNYNFRSKSKNKEKNQKSSDKDNKFKIKCENINKFLQIDANTKNKNDYLRKKCIYKNHNIKNNNNNIFQNNNFYTTNNFFNCSSKRIELSKNSSNKIYVKPSNNKNKRNNQSNLYLINNSPKNNLVFSKEDNAPNIMNYISKLKYNEKFDINNYENKNIKNSITYNKYRNKAFIKKNVENYNNEKNVVNIIKEKVINKYQKCTKYYNYVLKISLCSKELCYITKINIKPKYKQRCKRSFITKLIYNIIKRPILTVGYITKTNIIKKSFKNKNNSFNNFQNIIKANILDFSVEQNKEFQNFNLNHNRVIKYMGNEKNYQESFGEINLSFSTDEINSFKQRESTIEAVFTEFANINSLLNTENEAKVTFCPTNKNNNFINYECTTFGRIINDSSNFAETERNERTTYKRDEIIKEIKEKKLINLNKNCNKENYDLNLPLKLEECFNIENLPNTERLHLSKNNKKIINSKDVINFTEKLGNIFDKKKQFYNNNTERKQFQKNEENINDINQKCMTYFPKSGENNNYLEILNTKDLKSFNKLEIRNDFIKNKNEKIMNKINEFNKIKEQENESNFNITFNNKNNNINTKNEILYSLNIITIDNFFAIFEKIVKIIKEDNNNSFMRNFHIFSNLVFIKFDNEKKYSLIYAILCKYIVDEFAENKYKKIFEKDNNFIKLKDIAKKYEIFFQNNNDQSIYEEYKFKLYKNIINKENKKVLESLSIKLENNSPYLDIYNREILSLMKRDLMEYNINPNIYIISFNSVNYKMTLCEILQYFIEICIDYVDDNKLLLISNCNNYINKIIENYSSKNDIKKEKDNIIEIILNIDNIVTDNKHMFIIMGNLIYILINKEIFTTKDFDIFLNKDEYTLINIAKTIKYTVSYCNKDKNENFLIQLKETELFQNNSQIFGRYIFNSNK